MPGYATWLQLIFGEGDLSQLENLSNALAGRPCCGLGARDERNPVLVASLHWIAVGENYLGLLA